MPNRKRKNKSKWEDSVPKPDGTRVMKQQSPGKAPEFFRGARLMVSEDEVHGVFDEITDLAKRTFLESLSEIPRIGRAAMKAGVHKSTVQNWRRSGDQQFLQAFEVAWRMGVERAEGELWRRGFEGVEKPVYQSGRLVGTVREFDTPAAMFMLRGAMPERYREHGARDGSGSVSVGTVNNVHVTVQGLTTEELEARLKQAAAALGPGLPVIDVGSGS